MIVGLGSDICSIKRIEETYTRFGNRFVCRCFGSRERQELKRLGDDKARLAASLAKRFAAKESFVKALGSGFADGISWAEVEVVHQANGRPLLEVSGRALELLRRLTPDPKLWVSLSDDFSLAQAVVIIESGNRD